MTDDDVHIRLEVDDPVAYVTIDRPEKHNALTPDMLLEGAEAIYTADSSAQVRTIIITGAGDEAFCTGADLKSTIQDAIDDRQKIAPEEKDLFLREEPVHTPIVAAVNGLCVAGGMELLQATDNRVAEEGAQFGLQEPRWGLAPVAGSHVRLPRQVPYCRAMEYLLTGNLFEASHAIEAGSINEVVPDGESLSRAEEIANEIAENGPFAVRKIKEIVQRTAGRRPGDGFQLETAIGKEIFASEEAREGTRAFMQNREPSFRK